MRCPRFRSETVSLLARARADAAATAAEHEKLIILRSPERAKKAERGALSLDPPGSNPFDPTPRSRSSLLFLFRGKRDTATAKSGSDRWVKDRGSRCREHFIEA